MKKITLDKSKLELAKKTVKNLEVKTNLSAGRAAQEEIRSTATSCCCCQCC